MTPGASVAKFKRFWKLQENKTRSGIRSGYMALRRDLVKEARRLIKEPPKTGKLYKIPGRKRLHRASRAGEAPAKLTGALGRSISAVQRGWDELHFGADTIYARRLELGGGNIAKRPYLLKAIENNERNARGHFEREIERKLTI